MAFLLAGCAAERARDPFTATGEIIAFSGGDAGAVAACFTCHGVRGEGDGASTPRLAGLPVGYLHKQLVDYADGRRTHSAMERIANALDSGDRRSVAAYYAGLPYSAAVSPAPVGGDHSERLYRRGDPGRDLPPCSVCHGVRGQGVGPANPPLAGQPPAYLADQLHLWRVSKRRNDPRDVMLTISRRLTEAEAEALARYAAALPGGTAPGGARPAASP